MLRPMRFLYLLLAVIGLCAVSSLIAEERRAPAPKFTGQQTSGIFFENLSDAFGGQRPSLSSVRKSAAATPANGKPTGGTSEGTGSDGGNTWTTLVSPESLEDEIKRVKLHYDGVITTPSAFNSGGYQDARLDLTIWRPCLRWWRSMTVRCVGNPMRPRRVTSWREPHSDVVPDRHRCTTKRKRARPICKI